MGLVACGHVSGKREVDDRRNDHQGSFDDNMGEVCTQEIYTTFTVVIGSVGRCHCGENL